MRDDPSVKDPAMPTYRRLLIAWFFVPMHKFLFRLSSGRLMGRLEGHGIIVLVTTGRRSGRLRSSPLMYFQFRESDDLVVVASNYGLDRHPAWFLNLEADRNVSVEVGGERFPAAARITYGEERAALFDRVAAANPRFARYRASTDRQIPVVALRRGGASF